MKPDGQNWILFPHNLKFKQENMDTWYSKVTSKINRSLSLLLFLTCERVLVFQYVLHQIVHQLNTGLLCWFVGSLLFWLQQLHSFYIEVRDAQQNKHTESHTWGEVPLNVIKVKKKTSHFAGAVQTSRSLNLCMPTPERELQHSKT